MVCDVGRAESNELREDFFLIKSCTPRFACEIPCDANSRDIVAGLFFPVDVEFVLWGV